MNGRITRIDVCALDIPLKAPFTLALGTFSRMENILVRIYTEDGLYGTGEGAPFLPVTGETRTGALEAAAMAASILQGEDAFAIEGHIQSLRNAMPHNTAVLAAYDMALYDLLAKHAGLPLYRLLGGEKRAIPMDVTLGMESPEAMAEQARSLAARGIGAIKMKLGGAAALDIRRIRAVRDAVGPEITLRVDANQGWKPSDAITILRAVSDCNLEYCEQPTAAWNLEALRQVRGAVSIPVMADESLFDHHDAQRLIALGACDLFNIKLAKCGGIHTALKILSVAESAGLQCMLGCMLETRHSLTAAAHLAAARKSAAWADLDAALFLANDPVTGGIQYQGSSIILPDGPGIGADMEPSFYETLERKTISDRRVL